LSIVDLRPVVYHGPMILVWLAVLAEVLTATDVLLVDRSGLKDIGMDSAITTIVNVSESRAHSMAAGGHSTALQNLQLTTAGNSPTRFRISSRLDSMDAGIDFQLMTKVSPKREIAVTLVSQVKIVDNETSMPVFTGQPVRREITTAEGARVVVRDFVSSADRRQLATMNSLRQSPVLKYLFSGDGEASELVLVLTPGITRVEPPAVVQADLQNEYTVQVGSFRNQSSARALLAKLTKEYDDVFIQRISSRQTFYRVRVGRVASLEDVQQIERQLRSKGFNTFVSRTSPMKGTD
jgi:hypothetical protein